MLNSFFSFSGNCSWGLYLRNIVIALAIVFISLPLLRLTRSPMVLLIVSGVCSLIIASSMVRRLRTLNRPILLVLLIFVPFVNLLFTLLMIFMPAKQVAGRNQNINAQYQSRPAPAHAQGAQVGATQALPVQGQRQTSLRKS